MIKKNDVYSVTIEDLTHEGYGVAKVEGFTLFIENTLPHEKVKIHVLKVLKRYGFARVTEWIEVSKDRVEIKDKTGTRVGTMPLQHMCYPAQLALKKKLVVDTLSKEIDLDNVKVKETLGMKYPWQYRNKAQIPVREIMGHLETGFFKKNTHELIPIENFHIQEPIIDKVIVGVRDILREVGEVAYDEEQHTGNIRHIIVRRGHYTQQIMVILVTHYKKIQHQETVVDKIKELSPDIVSIVQNINSRQTNVILGQQQVVLYGNDYYEDQLLSKTYRISSKSFFQVNTEQTEVLYQSALDFADIQSHEVVMDAYCGIGSITLNLAEKAKTVYGVEVVEDAIIMAKENAKRNKLDNIEFITGAAEEVIQQWLDQKIKFDVVVVDPPRKGLDKTFIDSVLKVKPERIVYVSCNPATLARDLKYLVEGGYKVLQVQPVDMFPQTVHVECITLLTRK